MDVSVPGVIATVVAPVVAQLSVLLEPESMFAGLAVKDVTVGAEPVAGTVEVESGLLVEPPQLATPIHASRTRATAQRANPEELRAELAPPGQEVGKLKRTPSIATTFIVIAHSRWLQVRMIESRNASRIFCNHLAVVVSRQTLRLLRAAFGHERLSAAKFLGDRR